MKDKIPSTEELDKILTDLKSSKKTILECIIYIRQNYSLPLLDCSDIVLSSKVWESERGEFIKNHEEAELEFMKAWSDDVNGKNTKDENSFEAKTLFIKNWPSKKTDTEDIDN